METTKVPLVFNLLWWQQFYLNPFLYVLQDLYFTLNALYIYIKEKERKERREMINVQRILMNDAPELDIWA